MALFASSYIPTVATTVTRNRDALSYTFSAQPEAMTIYLRFLEAGSSINPALSSLISLGTLGVLPAVRIIIFGLANGSYQLAVGSSGLQGTSSVAASSTIGDLTELLATVAANGAPQLSSRIKGGAITVGGLGTAVTLPQAFPVSTLWLGSDNNAIPAYTAYMNLLIVRGVQSFGTMARLAGVN